MPWNRLQSTRIVAAMRAPWRRGADEGSIRRTVQGVLLTMPRAHMLPVFARIKPSYGQNLVALAAALFEADGKRPLRVVDIGANIGDSALQISARTGAYVLCVEGDPYWADYLHRNVDGNPRITVEEVLLLPDNPAQTAATAIRAHGTTRFVLGENSDNALPVSTATALRRRNPDFDRIRLIKSDTDGFDPELVPAAALAWRDCAPVLFFEFDPTLARAAGNDPDAMWPVLADLGYSHLAIWDNAGDPLGQLHIADVRKQTGSLEPRPVKLGYHFWDVAACHADDTVACAVFDDLVPARFDVRGTRR